MYLGSYGLFHFPKAARFPQTTDFVNFFFFWKNNLTQLDLTQLNYDLTAILAHGGGALLRNVHLLPVFLFCMVI